MGLKPGYLKAHHRRGKAYAALNEHENKEVNRDLMEARHKLKEAAEKGSASGSSGEAKAKKSDEEEEEGDANDGDKGDDDEPRIEDVTPNKDKPKDTTVIKSKPKPAASAKGGFVSKFPLKGARAIEEHTREAKRLMKQGGDEFLKKHEARQKGEPEPTPSPQDQAKKKKEEAAKKEEE